MTDITTEIIGPHADSKDNERLFYTMINKPGVEVRRMYTKRTADYHYSYCGKVIAARCDIFKRGKVIQKHIHIFGF